ncbi:TetR/AcrR family transcriptional regulator [Streptomyces sp. NPDC047043]|uniref:TetR/AcrR family transcriptional regulator n=1 Tax=Streptomyces sp. NPDC047043 TaxID=3154497 RepID=UPI0033ED7307
MSAEPAEPVQSPSRRRRSQRATSEELVEAAIRVIGREGVAAATTRKIAEEAGVPQGTVHYWFADKNELLQDVVRSIVERLEKSVATGDLPDGGTTAEDLRVGLSAAWAVVAGDEPGVQLGYYELTALALRNPSMRELARHQYRSYRDVAAHALAPPAQGRRPAAGCRARPVRGRHLRRPRSRLARRSRRHAARTGPRPTGRRRSPGEGQHSRHPRARARHRHLTRSGTDVHQGCNGLHNSAAGPCALPTRVVKAIPAAYSSAAHWPL